MKINDFLFDNPSLKLLEKSLDVQAKRVEASSSNIANIDTPDYHAVEVDFRNVYEMEMGRIDPQLPLATHAGHIGAMRISEDAPVEINLKERESGLKRVDGNNVNLDEEMSSLAQAQLQYSASVTALSRKLAMIAQAFSSKLS